MTLKHFLPFVAFVGFCKIQRFVAFVAFVAFVGFCKTSLALVLAWDPSPTPNVTYNLYYGPAHGFYSNIINCGTNCSHALALAPAPAPALYFFALTATNSFGESRFSNEISFVVPALAGTNLLISLALESALTVTGPWLTVTNSRTLITNYQSAPALFFRARLDTSITTNQ